MPFPGQSWPLDLKAIACIFHILAISSGIFRSSYRWHISRFGWEDTWALLALLTDVGCLTCSWLQRSVPLHPSNTDIILNWIATITLSSVPWEARLSMIAAIIRITNPRASIRRMSYAIAITFGAMWIAMLVQKMYICGTRLCTMTHGGVPISQLTTDGISDTFLVFMPIFFLKDVKISWGQRMLLVSSFASSICITTLSIAQSIFLFLPISSTSLLVAHIKAALSVVICNLLVVVTFTYRVYRKTDIDFDGSSIESEPIQFTSIIPGQLGVGSCSCSTSLPSPCNYCISSSRTQTNNVSPMPTRVHNPTMN